MKNYLLPGEIDQQIIVDVNGDLIKLDYRISSFGRVITLKSGMPKVLNPTIDKQGYAVVNLYSPFFEKGKKQFRVHRLVAKAFKENPTSLPIVHHKNSVKSDNRLENLDWVSPKTNVGEAIFRGDIKTIISTQEQYEIDQDRLVNKTSLDVYGAHYGVSVGTIEDMLSGKKYTHRWEKLSRGEYDDIVAPRSTVLSSAYMKSIEAAA